MLSNKPYLLRAFYDWIIDNECTPLLLVDATVPRCVVPEEFIENGEIILCLAPEAIRDLKLGASAVEFLASFSGQVKTIYVPMRAVLAVYAEENGQGMFFEPGDQDHYPEDDKADDAAGSSSAGKSRAHLKVIK